MGFWFGFAVVVAAALLFDLVIMGRRRTITVRASLYMTAGYVGLALAFGAAVWVWRGPEPALTYLAAYLLEKTLSLDNIFVFLLIFQHFRVPREFQHRVLLWGILGALVLRAGFIFAGIALIHAFQWVIYLFGVVVIFGGLRILWRGHAAPDLESNRLLRLIRSRRLPMTSDYRGGAFFVRERGRWLATPLFAVVIMVESTDVIFALDSIPAIFGLTRDPFIIYSSNVFAILGLRALYFALAGVVERFRYLEYGLSLVLLMIGSKMLLESVVEIPPLATIGVTLTVLLGSAALSLWRCRMRRPDDPECGPRDG
jgi:tellurite resistance protein TerC